MSAEQELAAAQAALADARSVASSVPTSATTAPPATTTTLVPAATITRVQQAEADLATTSSGITDATPLTQATAAYNSAAFALEIAWLKLLSDAGCLTDDQQAQAVAQVTEYTAALQTDLQTAGYYKGPVDGIYGPQTVDAVKQLQNGQRPAGHRAGGPGHRPRARREARGGRCPGGRAVTDADRRRYRPCSS